MDHSGTVSSDVRLAQVVGITASAWLSGTIAAYSYVGVQGALNARTPSGEAAKLWHEMYTIGAHSAPFIALVPASCFGYLAYDAANASSLRLASFRDTAFYLYAFAAVAIPSIAPYTFTVMRETNDTLHEKARTASTIEDASVPGLLEKWYWLNVARSVTVGVGCLAGVYATFGGL